MADIKQDASSEVKGLNSAAQELIGAFNLTERGTFNGLAYYSDEVCTWSAEVAEINGGAAKFVGKYGTTDIDSIYDANPTIEEDGGLYAEWCMMFVGTEDYAIFETAI